MVTFVLCMVTPLLARQQPHQEATGQPSAPSGEAPQQDRPSDATSDAAGVTQESEPASEAPTSHGVAVFRARSDLVVLHVNVFDDRADAVTELPEEAFEVYEDGVRQKIELFKDRTVPVATGLLIDNSSSMLNRRTMLAAGVEAFAKSSHDGDEMFTIVFNENVRYGLPGTVRFTQNPYLLEASLLRYRPGGMTALHDAVIEGLGRLEESTNQKRVLVVLSDGEDNASHQSESNMLYRAARSSAIIYTIWSGDVSTEHGDPGLLRKLATRSGGVAYAPETESEVVTAFTRIAESIRRVYSIGYAPTNGARDGSYRRVKVLVHAGGRQLRIRVREGYTAPDDANAVAR